MSCYLVYEFTNGHEKTLTDPSLPHTIPNSPQYVNKHQRAWWVPKNFLPEPMALFNLIPLAVTTVSPLKAPMATSFA